MCNPDDNPQSAMRNPQSAVTDSPWFWVLLFALMALVLLVAIGRKYERRQANIERNYQGRSRVAERVTREGENNLPQTERIEEQDAQREYATPGNQLIPVWPLAILLGLISIVAGWMLYRSRAAQAHTARRN